MASPNIIRDEKGRMVGMTQKVGDTTSYLDRTGKRTAFIHDGRTFDGKGVFKGYGDQGLRLFGK